MLASEIAQFFDLDAADLAVVRGYISQGKSLGDLVAAVNTLQAAGGGGGGGGYLERLRKKGGAGVWPLKRWMYAGAVAASVATTPPSTGQIYTMPIFSGIGGTLADIAFENTTLAAAGGVVRLGVYSNIPGDTYPGSLLYDSGDMAIDGATGVKQKNGLSIALTADSLYWATFLMGVATCTVRSINGSAAYAMWGSDINALVFSNTANYCLSHGFAYGALPSSFPTSAPTMISAMPLVAYTLV